MQSFSPSKKNSEKEKKNTKGNIFYIPKNFYQHLTPVLSLKANKFSEFITRRKF